MTELRTAAVLVPVFRDAEGELRVVLVVRADDGGMHGGQLGHAPRRRHADHVVRFLDRHRDAVQRAAVALARLGIGSALHTVSVDEATSLQAIERNAHPFAAHFYFDVLEETRRLTNFSALAAAGAEFAEYAGADTPASFGSPGAELEEIGRAHV